MAGTKRLVVIDGKSVFYRGYYAMPNLSLSDGTPTGGVFGFAVMALEVIKKMKPDYVTVAWDKPKTNIRRRTKIYPEYKANRKPAPPDFYEQIPLLHELLAAFGWPLYEIDDHEADDIMGTFAKQAKAKGIETILITSDHDVLQLVNGHTTAAILRKGLTNVELFDAAHFKEVYQMTPEQFVDYKSLRGDSSDNLPGVAGVGEKTAIQLIKDYGSLDGVYQNLEDIKATLKAKLEAGKDMAYMTKELVKLDCDIKLPLDFKAADISNVKPVEVVQILRKFQFSSLLKQLPKEMEAAEGEVAASLPESTLGKGLKVTEVTTLGELEKVDLSKAKSLALWSRSTGAVSAGLETLVVSSGVEKAYVLKGKALDGKALQQLLPIDKPVIGYDVKSTIKALKHLGVELGPVEHDVRIGAFLINSLLREQTLTKLSQDRLGYEGENLDEIPPEHVLALVPRIVAAIWGLYEDQAKELSKLPKVADVAGTIEWPIIPILAQMEFEGIQIDTDLMKQQSRKFEDSISDLEQQIYGYADQEFNISSPVQLSEILFETLQLPTGNIKKTKTAYSTAASELEKLKDQHPIIELIHKYREATKLKSTYVDVLPTLVDKNDKLHTTFDLDVAPTGRLSSHDPNLMNIPVRSELGNEIRKAFVPKKGNVFVSADYSQFELRLAAAMAGDKDMIEAFNKGLDVHALTASQMYGIDPKDVTKDQRRHAKVVNFGIMYGMSPHGLSEATGMTNKEAKEYIDKYFEIRKPLLKFIDELKRKAKEDGYVETLLGRRRPTPDVKSSNWVVRAAAERAAINMPAQGTEADLMKLAMIKADQELDDDVHVLLQIHDSLLVEVPKAKAEKVGEQLQSIMENIYPKLGVKLDVDVSIGKNWGEL